MPDVSDVKMFAALTNSAVDVQSGSRPVSFVGFDAGNTNAAWAFLQVFDLPAAQVTVGTTAPRMVIPLGPAVPTADDFSFPVPFIAGMSVAATTTATGNGAPAAGIPITIRFQEK